jgi:hypothetical protein
MDHDNHLKNAMTMDRVLKNLQYTAYCSTLVMKNESTLTHCIATRTGVSFRDSGQEANHAVIGPSKIGHGHVARPTGRILAL